MLLTLPWGFSFYFQGPCAETVPVALAPHESELMWDFSERRTTFDLRRGRRLRLLLYVPGTGTVPRIGVSESNGGKVFTELEKSRFLSAAVKVISSRRSVRTRELV